MQKNTTYFSVPPHIARMWSQGHLHNATLLHATYSRNIKKKCIKCKYFKNCQFCLYYI